MSQNPPPTTIKFGIVGCAQIARKVSRAILLSPSSTIAAVGSRSLEKAAAFAEANDFPATAKAYGSYEGVLDDPNVDAVYLPLPTSLHLKWAVLAARKKKHLLLEKPVALNVGELDEILKEFESNGLQIMDATMWMHHPRTEKMRAFLADANAFGQVKSINSTFGFLGNQRFLENNIRVKPDLDALGALGDVGWYCIRAILWATDYNLPSTVQAHRGTTFNAHGVIVDCGAFFHWEDNNNAGGGGVTATFRCSFLSNLTMDLTVVGTHGTLHVDDFVIPFDEGKAPFWTTTKSAFKELDLGWDPKPTDHLVSLEEGKLPQEALMVEEFSRLVGRVKYGGELPEKKWAIVSRKTQLLIDAVKASIDKGYEVVEIDGSVA